MAQTGAGNLLCLKRGDRQSWHGWRVLFLSIIPDDLDRYNHSTCYCVYKGSIVRWGLKYVCEDYEIVSSPDSEGEQA